MLLLGPFHLPPIPGAAAASPLNAGEPEPEPRRALRQPQHPGPPQSPHVTSAQPITAAPAHIKGAGCPRATPPGCPGGRASGSEAGRAGRVERGASRPRSVGAGHPLRARGHVRESVSHCPPPAGLGARNLPAVPPPPGSPPCRGAPRDSWVTDRLAKQHALHVRRVPCPLPFREEPRHPAESSELCLQITGYSGLLAEELSQSSTA